MSIHSKVAGIWQEIIGVWFKLLGVWTPMKAIYVKAASIWEKVYPDIDANLIFLFRSTDVLPVDGTSYTAALNRFPRHVLTASTLTTGGSGTHTNHGSATVNNSNSVYTHVKIERGSDNKTGIMEETSHSHTIGAHTHTALGDNIPVYSGFTPYTGVTAVYAGAYFLSDLPSLSGCTNVSATYLESYLYFESTSPISAGSYAHSHGSVAVNTNTFIPTLTNSDNNVEGGANYPQHYHSATHSSGSSTYPYYKRFHLHRVTSDLIQVPSGAILFLMPGASTPTGYTPFTPSTNRLVRISTLTPLSIGGNSTHTHYETLTTGGWVYTTSVVSRAGGSPYTGNSRQILAHTHTNAHSHTTARDHMPPYVNLQMVKKD